MADQRGFQILRAVTGVISTLLTWQRLMRSSGPNAAAELIVTTLAVAGTIGGILRPYSGPHLGPNRLDVRTRVGFFLLGLGMLRVPAYFVQALLLPSRPGDCSSPGELELAKRPLREQLMTMERHGKLFRVLAVLVALLSGVAAYSNKATRRELALFQMMAPFPALLGQLYPTLPVFGIARTRRSSRPWLITFAILSVPGSVVMAVTPLRTAFMSLEQYDDQMRRQEQWRETITWRRPDESADENGDEV